MSSSNVQTTKRDGYHHGDLRRVLVETARAALIEGVSTLSLRAVARRAGVSHASAYYHFKDKTALLAAVAISAFEDLTAATEEAYNREDVSALGRLKVLAQAYVRFALEHPQEFRLMFLPELRSDAVRTEVEQAGRAGYERMVALVAQLQREGRIAKGDPEEVAISAWAMMHGLATLMIDGPLYRNARTAEGREMLVANAVEHLLSGVLTA